MSDAAFDVDVTGETASSFAVLSGDTNPLHMDADAARGAGFRDRVLHGAYAGALISRLAGMELPGAGCLLHSMRFSFVAPIELPARLRVEGTMKRDTGEGGIVEAVISDRDTGRRYIDAAYEFSRRVHGAKPAPRAPAEAALADGEARVLVSGASGGIGGALLARLGGRGIGVSRRDVPGLLRQDRIPQALGPASLDAVVHCAGPMPDNRGLLDYDDAASAIDHHVKAPLADAVRAARLLADHGRPGGLLVLVGSTFAKPGSHLYRAPLYCIAKGMVPTLAKILALELAPKRMRCVGVAFDVLGGGMNAGAGAATMQRHRDRSPFGLLPAVDAAAAQIAWLLDNPSELLSGATIELTGGNIP